MIKIFNALQHEQLQIKRKPKISLEYDSRNAHTVNYNPGQNSWDTNVIARQIEASSLPPSPSVQC